MQLQEGEGERERDPREGEREGERERREREREGERERLFENTSTVVLGAG